MSTSRFANFDDAWARAAGEDLGVLSQRAQAIGTEAGQFAQRSLEEGTRALIDMARAASPTQAQAIQADYLRHAYSSAVAGATRMSDLYADLLRDASRPFEAMVARRR